MATSTSLPIKSSLQNFTDRIEPRKKFWEKYRGLEASLGQDCPPHILVYHGVGGIGKTTLLDKLQSELKEDRQSSKLPPPVYAEYSFQSHQQDSLSVLKQMRFELMSLGKYTFPMFEYGVYRYTLKKGDSAESPDLKQFTTQSTVLNLLLDALDFVPGVGIVPKALKLLGDAAGEGLSFVNGLIKKHKAVFESIEDMKPDTLYEYLPLLFSYDMQHNFERALKSKKGVHPVVIFLDTYEALSTGKNTSYDSESWLCGELGLIRNIPGVLWVIAGRNKLQWEKHDPYWKNLVNHCEVGNLSQEDSLDYLQNAGVLDVQLQNELYDLTEGTPLFLDICVRQYNTLCAQGQTPVIDMFGKSPTELIERFIRNLTDDETELVYILCALQSWTEPLLISLNPSIYIRISTYHNILRHSFIHYTDNGYYHMHKVMSETLLETESGKAIGGMVGRVLLEKYSSVLKEASLFSAEFVQALAYAARGAFLSLPGREEFRVHFERELLPSLLEFLEVGQLQLAAATLNTLEDYANERKTDRLYALWKRIDSVCARQMNSPEDAIAHSEASLALYRKILPENDPDVLTGMHFLALALNYAGKLDKALALEQEVLEKRGEILGAADLSTLQAKSTVAIIQNNLGNCELALTLQKEVLAQLRLTLSQNPNHPAITKVQSHLAEVYVKMGRHKEALIVRQDIWERQCSSLGEDDPRTLRAMATMADSVAQMGEREAAIIFKEQVVEKYRSTRGEDAPETRNAIRDLDSLRSSLVLHEDVPEIKQGDSEYAETDVSEHIALGDKPATFTGEENAVAVVGTTPPDTHIAVNKIVSSLGISSAEKEAILSGDLPKIQPLDVEEEESNAPAEDEASVSAASSKEQTRSMLADLAALMGGTEQAKTTESEKDPSTDVEIPAAATPVAVTEAPAEVALDAPAETPAATPAAPVEAPKKPAAPAADTLSALAALMASRKPATEEEKPAETAVPTEEAAPTAEVAAEAPAEVVEVPAETPAEAPKKAVPAADTLSALAALMASRKPATEEEKPAETAVPTEEAAPTAEVAAEAPAETPADAPKKAAPAADTLSALAALMASRRKPSEEEKKPEEATEETAPVEETGEAPAQTPAEAPKKAAPAADTLSALAALMASRKPATEEEKPAETAEPAEEAAPAEETATPAAVAAETPVEESAEASKKEAAPVADTLAALSSLIASRKPAAKEETPAETAAPANEAAPTAEVTAEAPAEEKKPEEPAAPVVEVPAQVVETPAAAEPVPAVTRTTSPEAEENLDVLRNVLEYHKLISGDQSPDTLNAMEQLVNALVEAKLPQEALPLCEQLLSLRSTALGEAHSDSLRAMQTMIAILVALGDTKKATALQLRLTILKRQNPEE